MRRLFVMLLCLLLPAALAAPEPPQRYHQATIGLFQRDEAMLTLEDGDVVNAVLPQGGPPYRVGQRVVVWQSGDDYIVQDPVRYPYLLALLAVFLVAALALGRGKGLRAVLGALLSLGVLLLFVVPRLAHGAPVVSTTLLGLAGILAFTVYFVHGLNRKTSAALLGTAGSALCGYLLTALFARAMQFTGTLSEGGYVASTVFGLNAQGLYLVGVVVGAIGALNDVTITQAAVVQALAHANPAWSGRELYRRAMAVGFDHIGSLINVLVLAYAAGSLPLFLLLSQSRDPWWVQLNGEGLSSELVSLLVGTTCLLLAVPLTTGIAARWFQGGRHVPGPHDHAHVH